MAHFAKIEDNIVTQVIVIDNTNMIGEDGNESEKLGADFWNKLIQGVWIQTSYNVNFRKNYASMGDTFDTVRDAFISPEPFPSWNLNEETCVWEAPIALPEGDADYYWDETTLSWIEGIKTV